jgi:predicted nucleotidyltransferase
MNQPLESLQARKDRRRSDVIASLKEWLRGRSLPAGMRTILFGSFAGLSFDAHSDVDVALIAADRATLNEVRAFALELLAWRPPHATGVDVVCLSEETWRSSGLADAIAAGIVIDCRDDTPFEAARHPPR